MAGTLLAKAFVLLLCINQLYSNAASNSTLTSQKSVIVQGAMGVMKRQANKTIHPVSGVSGLGVDTVHPRLEVRELERDADRFNVYLLGLQRFQNKSQDDKLSYFQISSMNAVHGRQWRSPRALETMLIVCSNLFPTWHRPYLALFKELLYRNAQEAISLFPSGELKDRMNVALRTFRLPYWDAAAVPPEGEGSYPACVQRRTAMIELPDGNTSIKTDIPNPLYSYTFHPLPIEAFKGDGPEFVRWNSTKRFPTSKDAGAESQDHKVAYELDANWDNLRQRTYSMLAMQKEYHSFSNNREESELNGKVVDSLESIHDSIHHTVGSGGHLTHIAYSAFDPVFWLLHANIDRMLAIWQALNPESYVTNHTNPKPTFTTPKHSWADENTPLHPFHYNSAGEFWTSATVRDHTIFGYTYPELVNLSDEVTLVRRVNALYGKNATSQFLFQGRDSILRPTLISHPTSSSSKWGHGFFRCQYFVNIRTRKAGAAFKVYIFLGAAHKVRKSAPSTDTSNWLRDPGFVGFTGFQAKGMDMMMDGAGENGVVALTKALEDRVRTGLLGSMGAADVKKYLKGNLDWRVSTANDQMVGAKVAEDLEIEVSYAKTKPATRNAFPEVQEGFKHLMHVVRENGGACGRA